MFRIRVEGIGKGVEVKAQMRRGRESVRVRLHFLICKVGTLLALIYLRIQEVIGMKFVKCRLQMTWDTQPTGKAASRATIKFRLLQVCPNLDVVLTSNLVRDVKPPFAQNADFSL